MMSALQWDRERGEGAPQLPLPHESLWCWCTAWWSQTWLSSVAAQPLPPLVVAGGHPAEERVLPCGWEGPRDLLVRLDLGSLQSMSSDLQPLSVGPTSLGARRRCPSFFLLPLPFPTVVPLSASTVVPVS